MFKVGDMVRIRDWEDMANQYPIRGGNIQCNGTFVNTMREFCGKVGKIKKIEDTFVILVNENGENIVPGYNVSFDMIEDVNSYSTYKEKYNYEELML